MSEISEVGSTEILTIGERYLLIALGQMSVSEGLGDQFWFDEEGVLNFNVFEEAAA